MRTPCGAHCQRGRYGDSNPNDVVDLRLSFVPGVGSVNARGERAWREPGSTRQDVGCGGGVFRRCDGFFGGDLRLVDEAAVGEDVHFRRGDSAADGCGAADLGTVRAWKLSADGGVRGGSGDGAAERGGEREPRRLLSGRDARGRWACVLARGWVLWAMAGPAVGPGLLCGPDVVYDWDHRLGVPGLPGPAVDCR